MCAPIGAGRPRRSCLRTPPGHKQPRFRRAADRHSDGNAPARARPIPWQPPPPPAADLPKLPQGLSQLRFLCHQPPRLARRLPQVGLQLSQVVTHLRVGGGGWGEGVPREGAHDEAKRCSAVRCSASKAGSGTGAAGWRPAAGGSLMRAAPSHARMRPRHPAGPHLYVFRVLNRVRRGLARHQVGGGGAQALDPAHRALQPLLGAAAGGLAGRAGRGRGVASGRCGPAAQRLARCSCETSQKPAPFGPLGSSAEAGARARPPQLRLTAALRATSNANSSSFDSRKRCSVRLAFSAGCAATRLTKTFAVGKGGAAG